MSLEDNADKLRRFLAATFPNLPEEKVDELAARHAEFASFIVRLWMQKHPKSPENGLSEEFEQKNKDPPV